MKHFFVKWLINIAALIAVIHIIAGVSADSWLSIITAALVLGLLNAFLRPALIFFTLPLSIFSLGFFTLIINGLMLYLASMFVPGFNVVNFWSAFWASLLFSAISFILNIIFGPRITINMGSFRSGPYARPKPKIDNNVIDVEGKVEE